MWHVCGRGKLHAGFWWGDIREGGTRCEWEDNIKMGLQKVGLRDVGWSDVAQDRDMWRTPVNAVMNP
jgi:hypothetical protein